MQQQDAPPLPVIDYATARSSFSISWRAAAVVGFAVLVLNVIPWFHTSVSPGIVDGLEDLLGWPVPFLWEGGIAGGRTFIWWALVLDALVLGGAAIGLGRAAYCITTRYSGHARANGGS
jgi:hypothetical protein